MQTLGRIILGLLVILSISACQSDNSKGTSSAGSSEPPPSTPAVAPMDMQMQETSVSEFKIEPQPQAQYITPPNLGGRWMSAAPEAAGNGRYVKREFNFHGNQWEMIYTLASDREMTKPLFVHRVKGTFTLQKASARTPGAYLISFRPQQKFLRIASADKTAAKELGFEGCGLLPNTESDISARGCGIILKVSECPNDYDLIREELVQQKQNLSLGNRFAEFSSCTEDKRPIAMGPPLIQSL